MKDEAPALPEKAITKLSINQCRKHNLSCPGRKPSTRVDKRLRSAGCDKI
jgi:hypothetical protein